MKSEQKKRTVTYAQASKVIERLFDESGDLYENALNQEKLSKLSKLVITQLEEIIQIKLETDNTLDSASFELYKEILNMIQGLSIVYSTMGNSAEKLIAVSRNIDEITAHIDDYFSTGSKYTFPC